MNATNHLVSHVRRHQADMWPVATFGKLIVTVGTVFIPFVPFFTMIFKILTNIRCQLSNCLAMYGVLMRQLSLQPIRANEDHRAGYAASCIPRDATRTQSDISHFKRIAFDVTIFLSNPALVLSTSPQSEVVVFQLKVCKTFELIIETRRTCSTCGTSLRCLL